MAGQHGTQGHHPANAVGASHPPTHTSVGHGTSHVSAGHSPTPASTHIGGGGFMASVTSLFSGTGHKAAGTAGTVASHGGGHSSHDVFGTPDPAIINGQRETYCVSLEHQKEEALKLLERQRDQQMDFIEQAKQAQIARLKSEIAEKAHHHEHHIKQVHHEAERQRKKQVEELEDKVREQEIALQIHQQQVLAQKEKLQKEIDDAEKKRAKALREHHEEIEHDTHHLIYEIQEKARQQELALKQRYSNLQMELEKQTLEKKVTLEKQAVDLALEWQKEKVNHEKMEHWLAHQPAVWKYFPDFAAPIDIRATPAINGPRSGGQLQPGEVFKVSKEMYDQRLGMTFLKLWDGRGWVFDTKPGVGTMCHRLDPHDYHFGGHGHDGGHGGGHHDASGTGMLMPPSMLETQLSMQGPADVSFMTAHTPAGHADSSVGSPGSAMIPHGPAVHASLDVLPAVHAAPPAMCATLPIGSTNIWVHKPDYHAPLQIRRMPDIEGGRTEHMLMPGEVFGVSEELVGSHDVRFLRLADGRGWVFDRKPGVGMMCYRQPQVDGGAMGVSSMTMPGPAAHVPPLMSAAGSQLSSHGPPMGGSVHAPPGGQAHAPGGPVPAPPQAYAPGGSVPAPPPNALIAAGGPVPAMGGSVHAPPGGQAYAPGGPVPAPPQAYAPGGSVPALPPNAPIAVGGPAPPGGQAYAPGGSVITAPPQAYAPGGSVPAPPPNASFAVGGPVPAPPHAMVQGGPASVPHQAYGIGPPAPAAQPAPYMPPSVSFPNIPGGSYVPPAAAAAMPGGSYVPSVPTQPAAAGVSAAPGMLPTVPAGITGYSQQGGAQTLPTQGLNVTVPVNLGSAYSGVGAYGSGGVGQSAGSVQYFGNPTTEAMSPRYIGTRVTVYR